MAKDTHVYHLNILGREYPIKCSQQEEIELKEIEEALKMRLSQYRLKYEKLDNQDVLSMALIEILMDHRQSAQAESMTSSMDKLDRIHSLLQDSIS